MTGGSKMGYSTEQEAFWSGQFGDEYIDRNRDESRILPANIALFSEILRLTRNIESAIEFGANIGLNLKALKALIPQLSCAAVEINHKAAEILRSDAILDGTAVFEESILEYSRGEPKYDFVLTKGILIHINPDELGAVYQKLYDSSKKYICICEYYNPTLVTVNYRGYSERLYKRDFCGEMMDRFNDLKLVDYGFKYHRDNNFAEDDMTWFLLEK